MPAQVSEERQSLVEGRQERRDCEIGVGCEIVGLWWNGKRGETVEGGSVRLWHVR